MMKLAISRERLREKIATSPDLSFEAGLPTGSLKELTHLVSNPRPQEALASENVRMKEAFGVLVRQLRRRERLSISDLSQKARVNEVEVKQIEQDPRYVPRPRTVHQLSVAFNLPERALMKLSGATKTHNAQFQEAAYRFAAKSEGLSKLSSEEARELNNYIKFLAQHSED